MVRRIRVVLCLEAKTAAGWTKRSIPSPKHVGGKICGKQLNPRLRCEQFHDAAGFRVGDRSGMGGRLLRVAQHPQMIVSLPKEELFIFIGDPEADRR